MIISTERGITLKTQRAAAPQAVPKIFAMLEPLGACIQSIWQTFDLIQTQLWRFALEATCLCKDIFILAKPVSAGRNLTSDVSARYTSQLSAP
jgi:5-methylthioribose kinase